MDFMNKVNQIDENVIKLIWLYNKVSFFIVTQDSMIIKAISFY